MKRTPFLSEYFLALHDYSKYAEEINTNHPETKQHRHNLVKCLKTAVKNDLTVKQQKAVEMYYFKEMTQKEIAEEMNISISSVSRLIMRARNRIKRNLKYLLKQQ